MPTVQNKQNAIVVGPHVLWIALVVALLAIACALVALWALVLVRQTPTPTTTPTPTVTTAEPAAAPTSPADGQVFDSCKPLAAYEQEPWFDTMLEVFRTEAKSVLYTHDDGTTQATEGCYAAGQRLFIFVIPTGYSQPSVVWRYNVDTQALEPATFDPGDRDFHASATEFGPREDNLIHMSAITGDAGSCAIFYYDYDYAENDLRFVSSSSAACSEVSPEL